MKSNLHPSACFCIPVPTSAAQCPPLQPSARLWTAQPHLPQALLRTQNSTAASRRALTRSPSICVVLLTLECDPGAGGRAAGAPGPGSSSQSRLRCFGALGPWEVLWEGEGAGTSRQVLPVLSFPDPCPRSGLSSRLPRSSGARFLVPSPPPSLLLRHNKAISSPDLVFQTPSEEMQITHTDTPHILQTGLNQLLPDWSPSCLCPLV